MTDPIVIVGAGIVGAACAAECARSGLNVLVLEQSIISGGATAAGMGHLVVMDDSPAQLALTAYSCRLWRDMALHLPADVEYDGCGTLWIAADDEEMHEVRRKKRLYDEHEIVADVLDGSALADAEPNLRRPMNGALRVPHDAVLYPPCAARFLLDQARSAGATVRTGARVSALKEDGTVILADGSRITSRITVNAAGCAAPDLSPDAPVVKRKGHLVITERYPGFVRHQLVELGYLKSAHSTTSDSVAFNVQPRKTGQLLIGSSRQFNADDSAVDPEMLSQMIDRAREYLPGIGELKATRVWTGHRPTTPDKLPLIGPSPGNERIWLATGHEGLGITTSLGTGRLLADLILGRNPEIPAEPYLPKRFMHAEALHA